MKTGRLSGGPKADGILNCRRGVSQPSPDLGHESLAEMHAHSRHEMQAGPVAAATPAGAVCFSR
jgi:hypothetical protein